MSSFNFVSLAKTTPFPSFSTGSNVLELNDLLTLLSIRYSDASPEERKLLLKLDASLLVLTSFVSLSSLKLVTSLTALYLHRCSFGYFVSEFFVLFSPSRTLADLRLLLNRKSRPNQHPERVLVWHEGGPGDVSVPSLVAFEASLTPSCKFLQVRQSAHYRDVAMDGWIRDRADACSSYSHSSLSSLHHPYDRA